MPDGWIETTLGEIAEVISRGRAPSYCEEDGVVVLNQKCIRNGRIHFEFARRTDIIKKTIPDWAYLRIGDTLINSTGVGTLGRASFVARLNSPTTFDSHLTLVRPRPDSSFASFIGLSLNFRENEIEMFAGGSTGQTELSREAVNSFPISLPPLAEQKRIVDVVSSVDAYIDALQQQAVTARTARNAVLHELLSVGGDNWTETTLGDIASWSSGKNLSSNKRHETGLIPILGANGIIGRTTEVLLDEELITVWRVGACGETHRSSGPVWISDNALIVIPKEQVIIDLLFYVLSTFNYQSIISGTTQPLITQSKMKSQVVNLPPLDEQKRIVEIVSSMDEVIRSTEQAVSDAKSLRSGLLSDLLSGEHEIPASYDSLLGAA